MGLILLVGLPRSGKTTWAHILGHPIVSPDSIRLSLHGKAFLEEAEPMVWTIAEMMTRALLREHKYLVVDSCNVTTERRAWWYDRFPVDQVKVLRTHPEDCIRRAKYCRQEYLIPVIERMAEKWDYGDFDPPKGDPVARSVSVGGNVINSVISTGDSSYGN